MNNVIIKKRYKLIKVIGQGGIGNVYLAQDLQTKRYLAIKQSLETSEKMIERFKREYKFLKYLQHPNIVKGYDFVEEKNNYFLVMEYVHGISLKDILKNNQQSFCLEQQLSIAIQICRAVDALNINDIVHRDIKPDNIMITDKNIVKLLDLGIAKSTNKEMSVLTKTGTIIGTPEYISPEQITNTAAKNSDVFSIGIVFYQLFLSLENSPFFTGNLAQTLNKVVHKDLPPFISNIKESQHLQIYQNLSDVLEKALQKKPEKRTSSARELGEQLWVMYQHLKKQRQQPQEKFSLPEVEYKSTKDYILNTGTEEAILETQNARNTETKNNTSQKNVKILLISQTISSLLILLLLIFGYILKKENSRAENKIVQLQDTVSSLLEGKLLVHKELLQKISTQQLLSNDRVEVFIIMGNDWLEKGNYEKALSYFNQAIEDFPHYSKSYFSAALTLQLQKQYEKAKVYYDRAIEINPDNPYYYTSRGSNFFHLKKYSNALENYNMAISLEKSNHNIFANRAAIYTALSNNEKAIEDYTTAIAIAPQNFHLYALRGNVFYQMQKYSQAVSDFETNLKFHSKKEPQVEWLLAKAKEKLK